MPPNQPDQSQTPQGQMSNDDLAALLGFTTTISEQHHMANQAMENPQEPGQTDTQTPEPNPEIEDLKKQVEQLQKEIKKDPKDEIKEIRKMVEEALAAEDTHGGQKD